MFMANEETLKEMAQEVAQEFQAIEVERAQLRKRVAELEAKLAEVKEEAADRMDVVDGADGTPSPDAWMRLYTSIEEVLP